MITIAKVIPVHGRVWTHAPPGSPPAWVAHVRIDVDGKHAAPPWSLHGRPATLARYADHWLLCVPGEEWPPDLRVGDVLEGQVQP